MTSATRIRIVCIDDHPIVREGLVGVLLLEPDMELAGQAGSGKDAIELYRRLRPDVLVLDLRLGDLSGFEVLQQILAEFPGARILVLTSLEGDTDIERALALGARGYLVKGCAREELIRAVRAVHAGEKHIPAEVARKLVEHLSSEKLTARELEVLALVARGKSNKQVGLALSIAEDTVKMHLKNLLGKLGATDRTEAVTTALRRGIIHLP